MLKRIKKATNTQNISRIFLALCVAMLGLTCGIEQPDLGQNSNKSALSNSKNSVSFLPILTFSKGDNRIAEDTDLASFSLDYLLAHRSDFDLKEFDGFEVKKVAHRKGGHSHVRLIQTYQDIPVFGGELIVHRKDSEITMINGNLVVGINLDTKPAILAEDAVEIGHTWFDTQVAFEASGQDFIFEREQNKMVIFKTNDNYAHLAYQVIFFNELQHGVNPGLWNVFVDAKNGDVLLAYNAIDSLSQASGPGGNPNHTQAWVDELDVEDTGTPGLYMMDTLKFRTTNLNNGTSGPGTIVTGPLDPIGDAPINDAHGYAEATWEMLTQMGHPNSIDDAGFKLISRVHYGVNYENANWDGTQMTYGDGAVDFYPLSGALDVVAHEICHGFTEFHSGLVYMNQSGGMNESFSDISGTIAEFIYEGVFSADWLLGEDIRIDGTALRWMCTPTTDGESIDNFDDYYDWMDVHYSSGIMNKAYCRIAKRYATGNPDGAATLASIIKSGQAFFKANDSYWVSSSTFEQGCQGVVAAANELGHSQQEIDWIVESYLDVGVYCYGEPLTCDETFTTDSGSFTTPNYPSDYPSDFSYTWCVEPGGGKEVTLTFDDFATESGYDFVTVYDANEILLSNTSGATAPADAVSTKIFVQFESDYMIEDRGFLASWTSSGGLVCDETFTTDSGTFSSPNYPADYPNNYEHVWCIDTASGLDVVLDFTDFNTQSGADIVTIYDESFTELASSSGSSVPPILVSSMFYIHFASGASGTDSGFEADWYPLLDNGLACSNEDMCLSGNCVDGVCCGTPCAAECYSCDIANHLGECYPDNGGTICGDQNITDCSGPDACDGAGNCDPQHATIGSECGDQGVECLQNDSCDGNGNCTDNGYEASGTACGDSSDSECSNPDTCNGAGTCSPNNESVGSACGDQGVECLQDDTCDGSGNCSDNGYAASGTACGDQNSSECDNADSCDGAGACLANFVDSGESCGNQGVECRVDDSCDGAGNCSVGGFENAGTACGDSNETTCSAADTCDGAGTCDENHASSGTACGDQGVECLVDDACDASGNCVDNGYAAAGAACGDSSDTECTNPDSCDGGGTCLSNHAAAGAACGDQSIECLVDDSCDGSGTCTDNGFAAVDTACGDATDDDCTDPDSCDAAGNCLVNDEADGTACQDNSLFCDGAETCQSGSCQSAGDPCDSTETCNEDNDTCDETCGNGTITGNEECDDDNVDPGDGCSELCQVEDGWTCSGEPSDCSLLPVCGDGAIDTGEGCDDDNLNPGDGCSADCQVEDGWTCSGEPSDCSLLPVCGDGTIDTGEACDDDNTNSGDGCSSDCQVEAGWNCTGEPSVCTEMTSCGNGTIDSGEQCDDDNTSAGDGCSDACQVEDGWNCTGEPSVCNQMSVCGDGAIGEGETCDDENTVSDDGCSADCQVEDGWTCRYEPSACVKDEGGCGCATSSSGTPTSVLLSSLIGFAFVINLRRNRRRR
jgi:cysteine-rich repeat protein